MSLDLNPESREHTHFKPETAGDIFFRVKGPFIQVGHMQ